MNTLIRIMIKRGPLGQMNLAPPVDSSECDGSLGMVSRVFRTTKAPIVQISIPKMVNNQMGFSKAPPKELERSEPTIKPKLNMPWQVDIMVILAASSKEDAHVFMATLSKVMPIPQLIRLKDVKGILGMCKGSEKAVAKKRIPPTVIRCIPTFCNNQAAKGLAVKEPMGIDKSNNPNWASSRLNFCFTTGMKVAQLPNKNPIEKKANPMAKVCFRVKNTVRCPNTRKGT